MSSVRCLPVHPSSRPRYDYAAWPVLLLRLVRLVSAPAPSEAPNIGPCPTHDSNSSRLVLPQRKDALFGPSVHSKDEIAWYLRNRGDSSHQLASPMRAEQGRILDHVEKSIAGRELGSSSPASLQNGAGRPGQGGQARACPSTSLGSPVEPPLGTTESARSDGDHLLRAAISRCNSRPASVQPRSCFLLDARFLAHLMAVEKRLGAVGGHGCKRQPGNDGQWRRAPGRRTRRRRKGSGREHGHAGVRRQGRACTE